MIAHEKTVEVEWGDELHVVPVSNGDLELGAVWPVEVPADDSCLVCRKRGFWPRVFADDCPECYGEDEHGDTQYCAQCQFCCGC